MKVKFAICGISLILTLLIPSSVEAGRLFPRIRGNTPVDEASLERNPLAPRFIARAAQQPRSLAPKKLQRLISESITETAESQSPPPAVDLPRAPPRIWLNQNNATDNRKSDLIGDTSERPLFHFQDRDPMHHDLKRSYRNLTQSMAARVWHDPKGKRILLDVNGHPGIAVEIPIN